VEMLGVGIHLIGVCVTLRALHCQSETPRVNNVW